MSHENPELLLTTPTLKSSRLSDESIHSSACSEQSLVIDTRVVKTPLVVTPLIKKESSQNGGSVPSFHIQKTLNVNGAFAKILFDFVKLGDIAAVKKQEDRIGLDIQFLYDDQLKQNALFTAVMIKEEALAV